MFLMLNDAFCGESFVITIIFNLKVQKNKVKKNGKHNFPLMMYL